MTALSPTQSRILEVVAAFIADKQRAPTVREVATRAGLSCGYTHRVINRLQHKGRVERQPYTHRSIKVIGAASGV